MTFKNFTLPAIVVNNYVWHTMKQIEPTFQKQYGTKVPFFPLSDSASGEKSWENKPYVIYDRMLRTTSSPFYPIKREHIRYAVKANEVKSLEWGMAIQYILDRQDDAAEDINNWNRNQENPANVYFHHLRVYQDGSGESTTRDFSNRPYYITEFIIDAEYHLTDTIEDYLS
jgi:hypothetical protein